MRYDYMICPVRDLGTSAWSGATCDPNPVFIWRSVSFPPFLVDWVSSTVSGSFRIPSRSLEHRSSLVSPSLYLQFGFVLPSLSYAPFQIHAVVMAAFASLFAPFGGFFASGFKRAFNIKDFGHSIPGHGGMTDRMDCQ